jgi:hypothetical protein
MNDDDKKKQLEEDVLWKLKEKLERDEFYHQDPQMKITIYRAENGFIIENTADCMECKPQTIAIEEVWKENCECGTKAVVCKEGSEVATMKKVLGYIMEQFGVSGSRHSNHRLYLVDRPGDKNSGFTNKDSEVIWGKPKDADMEVFNSSEEENDELLKEHDKKNS